MKKDIFKWKMSAEMHKNSVYTLRNEIIEHYNEQKEMSISLILDLLPLETNDTQTILDRGNISFDGDNFENNGDESWIEFHDQVLGDYFATIKELWSGNIKTKDEEIVLEFTTPIELEIPQLTNLGVNRSAFQILKKIISTKETTISILVDSESEVKETWIDAVLDNEKYNENKDFKEDLENYLLFDTSENSCGKDPEEPNWYVYKRITDGLCFVHYGRMMNQAHRYILAYGPSKKKDCDNWANNNCI